MPRRRVTKLELELRVHNLQDTLKTIERYARRMQSSLCCYGTTHGDRRPCDCKYLNEDGKYSSGRYHSSEQTGCCEARIIIEEILKARE